VFSSVQLRHFVRSLTLTFVVLRFASLC